jgi:hypothetical protein
MIPDHRRAIIATIIAMSVTANTFGIELPFDLESGASAVEVHLDGADVAVTCAEREDVGLIIRPRLAEGGAGAGVAVSDRGSTLSITQAEDATGPSEVVIELAVPEDLPVTVVGSRLNIVRTCIAVATDEPDRPIPIEPTPGVGTSTADHVTAQPASLFELEKSTVESRGSGSARYTGTDNSLTLIGTNGDTELAVSGSVVDVSDHRGSLVLEVNNTEVTLRSAEGKLAAKLDGGALNLVETVGETTIQLIEANLDVDNHRGVISVTASLSDLALRGCVSDRLAITGDDSVVRLDGGTATGTVNLTGGSLEVDGWNGRLMLQGGNGADLEAAGVEGDVVVSLDDGSLELRGVTGHTRATASSSNFTASNLKSIALSAQDCVIDAREIPEVKLIRLANGELTLGASSTRGKQRLELSGEVWARIELPTPCEVNLLGEDAASADVDVRGCDLHGGGGPGTQRPQRRLRGQSLAILDVTLGAGTRLRVEGRPS